MPKKSIILISAVLAIVAYGCDEHVTEAGKEKEEEDKTYAGLVIRYVPETGASQSAEITPAGGGSVTAVGTDGAAFSLAVPPGAVQSPVTVTVTPLMDLSIATTDSSHVDTTDCIVGALFEPEGLEFDPGAFLTITYPPGGLNCVLSEYFCIVSVDSLCAYYEIVPTTVDLATPSLSCTLAHFSGYGTHNPDYDYLKYLIESYSKYGRDFPGDDILEKLMSLAAQATAHGWDDLKELAWQGAHPILDYLASGAIAHARADPCEATLGVLLHYLEPAQSMGFGDIENKLTRAINDVVVAVAKKGRNLCQSGDEEQGGALLAQALEWAAAGLVLDTSTTETITGWLADCAGFEVLLAADNTMVRTAATSASNVDGALLTLTVTVLDGFGGAVEGCGVTIRWDGSGSWSGTTGPGGIFAVTLSGSHMGVGPYHCPPHSYNRTFYAVANAGGAGYRSNDLAIQFCDIRITSTVSYALTFRYAEGELSQNIDASIAGGGTGCFGLCDGTLTRSYSKVVNDVNRSTAVGQLEIPACAFTTYYVYAPVGDSGLTVAVLEKVYQDVCYMLDDVIIESCEGTQGCTTGETDLYPYLPEGAWPINCNVGTSGDVIVKNDGTGVFEYLWEDSDSGPTWSRTASLNVSVTVDF